MSKPRSDIYWRGQPIEDLTPDELLQAFVLTSAELQALRSPETARAIGLGTVEMIKRGEKLPEPPKVPHPPNTVLFNDLGSTETKLFRGV